MPSKKVLEEKQQVVADLAEQLKKSCVGVVVDYKGISVADDTKLRKELRESGDQYKVVKNTLLKLALKEAGIEGLDPVLEGTTAVALSDKDYIHAAKTLYTFEKNTKGATLKVKAGFVDGKVLSKDDVAELATLPSKEELVAKVLGSLNAPITGFVTVLNGTMKALVVALNAIAEKQGAEA